MAEVAPNALDPTDRPAAWRAWWLAARPATLTASAAPVLVASALAAQAGQHRPEVTFLALLGAALIQIGTNLSNDYFDWKKGADTAERLGPPRATQRGWLTPRQVGLGSALAFFGAIAAGVGLVAVGGWPIVWVGLLSVAAGLAYTAGPFALAYLGLGEVFVLAFFGVVAVAGTYYLHHAALSPGAWWVGGAMGSLAAAILVVNNLRDREGDARAAKRTLVVRFGQGFGRAEYVAFLLGAYVLVGLGVTAGALPLGALLVLLSLPLALKGVEQARHLDGPALNPLLGGTARLELLFAVLLSLGVLA